MEIKKRFEKVKIVFTKPYIYSFIIIFLLYLTINYFINGFSETAPVFFSFNLNIIIPLIIFNLFIAVLVGVTINLIYIKFKEYKKIHKGHGFSSLGMFVGLLGGACPGCFAGLFPAFMGLFGITASLSSLPLFGMELQLLSIILLLISIYLLTNDDICKIKRWGK